MDLKEFDDHRLVVTLSDKKSGLEGFIVFHRIHSPHPSLGATRVWKYSSSKEVLEEAFRLSRAMYL